MGSIRFRLLPASHRRLAAVYSAAVYCREFTGTAVCRTHKQRERESARAKISAVCKTACVYSLHTALTFCTRHLRALQMPSLVLAFTCNPSFVTSNKSDRLLSNSTYFCRATDLKRSASLSTVSVQESFALSVSKFARNRSSSFPVLHQFEKRNAF